MIKSIFRDFKMIGISFGQWFMALNTDRRILVLIILVIQLLAWIN